MDTSEILVITAYAVMFVILLSIIVLVAIWAVSKIRKSRRKRYMSKNFGSRIAMQHTTMPESLPESVMLPTKISDHIIRIDPGDIYTTLNYIDEESGKRLWFKPDGNLVIMNANGKVDWESGTWGNRGATLRMKHNGELCIYDMDNNMIWRTKTTDANGADVKFIGTTGTFFIESDTKRAIIFDSDWKSPVANKIIFRSNSTYESLDFISPATNLGIRLQPNGNLVIHDTANTVLWNSGTSGNPGARLRVAYGNLYITSVDNFDIWGSDEDNNGGYAVFDGLDGSFTLYAADDTVKKVLYKKSAV